MYDQILYEVKEPVATITLNRPDKLNATTPQMIGEVRHALAQAEDDKHVIGIVITGAGRGFCSGADMTGLQAIQREGRMGADGTADLHADPGDPEMGEDFRRGYTYFLSVRKPIIAAINGPCAGYGFSMAMFCDMRFVSESAMFTTAFAPRGLVAEHGMSWILPRLLGTSRALDILWSGRKFGAEEALQLGVANRVVPPEQLLPETHTFIRELGEKCSPISLMHMKQQIYRDLMERLDDSMRDTEARMAASVKRPDFKEGIASFMERRPPEFPRIGT